MVLLTDYMSVLISILITEGIILCSSESMPDNSKPMPPNMMKWYYSPENGNNSLTTRIFPQQNPQMKEDSVNETPRILNEPQCPDGGSYCQNIPDYPYQLLREVLNSNIFQKKLFKNQNPFIDFRSSGVSEEETVCGSIREIIRPMAASNYMGKRKFILNQEKEEEFVQEIHVEKCRPGVDPESPCGSRSPNRNQKTGCKQKYLEWRLFSFSIDGEVSIDTFLFPSACSCIYTIMY